MILFPAVDIRDGRAVRLVQGDYARETVYFDDPLEAARAWEEQGATHLHVVDLDGARSGERRNLEQLRRICEQTALHVQYGGGLRDAEALEQALAAGAWRVVIGTAAFRDRPFLERAVADHGSSVVVSADARDGRIAAQGWTEATEIELTKAVAELSAAGVRAFVHTDIARDGMLSGTDLDGLRAVAAAAGDAVVVASGGVGSLEDLDAVAALDLANVEGVIAGKALYEGRFTLAEGLRRVSA